MQENYKQNQDRASASLERTQTPEIVELESNIVKLSIIIRCTAPEGWRCDDKREPNAMCFSLPRPCRFIEFVKVEIPEVIVC